VRTGFWWGNLRKRDHLEDSGVDGRVILKWIFKMWDEGGMDLIALAQNRDKWCGSCKCSNDPSGSIKCTEF
jgi:hypothetical protein